MLSLSYLTDMEVETTQTLAKRMEEDREEEEVFRPTKRSRPSTSTGSSGSHVISLNGQRGKEEEKEEGKSSVIPAEGDPLSAFSSPLPRIDFSDLSFITVTNDGSEENFKVLSDLKNIFSRQVSHADCG